MFNCSNMTTATNNTDNLTNVDDEMSHEAQVAKLVGYYTMDVGVPIVCGFGMLGNILNLMVLTREKINHSLSKMENSAHIGLIALAVSDFMFCLLAFLYTQLDFQEVYHELSIVLYYEWLGSSFITVFIITSTWLTVYMAGERYIAVCHPFKARKLISLRRTRMTVFLVCILCISATIPLGFEKVIKPKNSTNGTIVYSIEKRPEFSDSVIGIRRLVWAILFDFIPCVALLYFNTCLIYKIHRAKTIRRQMAPAQKKGILLTRHHPRELFSYSSHSRSSGSNHTVINLNSSSTKRFLATQKNSPPPYSYGHSHNTHTTQNHHQVPPPVMTKSMKAKRRHTDNALNSVTATLVAVVVLFLIFVSPSEILKYIFLWSGGTKTHTYHIIRSITNLMQAINFSVNFLLYCAVNKSFRRSFRKIFCICRSTSRCFRIPNFTKAYCHSMELSESES